MVHNRGPKAALGSFADALVEQSSDALIAVSADGAILSWNRGAEDMFGYPRHVAIGCDIDALIVPHDRRHEALADRRHAIATGEYARATVRQRADGHHIDVDMVIRPVLDPSGALRCVAISLRDFSIAHRSAEHALQVAHRELEAFSYSVAHDLRAPLRGMNGFAQLLLDEYGEKLAPDAQDWLVEIRANTHRMASLIDALLSLARVARIELKRESVDLSEMARAAASQLAAADAQRRVRVVVAEGLSTRADPALARAVIEDLLDNAWKFTRKVPHPRIEVGAVEGERGHAFYVRDNGAGFDMAFAGRLFAPFQRLHTVSEFPGTGIGLASVHRILARHGGRIWADGRVDRGATFYFTFAAAGAP